jgi:hypothetical protein
MTSYDALTLPSNIVKEAVQAAIAGESVIDYKNSVALFETS